MFPRPEPTPSFPIFSYPFPAKSPQNSTAQPVAAPGSPNPQRPPIRPNVAVRSKFELEPNPFEQSFSRSSHHSSSSLSEDREQRGKTPPRGGDATSIKHHALPPLSSLTSPAAADPSQFPWLANQSLRTGPLSPAMLAGPTQAGNHQASSSTLRPSEGTVGQNDQPFDGTTFRTGFTPGTGSGFTPGYNSLMNGTSFGALPMPSPNTAAFLNMVTNSTPLGEGETGAGQGQDQNQAAHSLTQPPSAIPPHMQSHHGLSHLAPADAGQDTITPNTLSALTGVFNDMNRQQVQAQHPGQMNPSHPPMHGPAAGQTHPTYYPMHGPAPPPLPQAHHAHPHSHMAGMGMPPPPHIDYAQQSANAASQAANGLFLLSQAHQELSKREEERGGPTNPVAGAGTGPGAPLMGKRTSVGSVPPGSGKPPLSAGMSAGGGGSGTGVGQKRKSDTISGSALTSGGTGKGAKKGKKNAGGAAAVNIDNSPTNSNGRMGAGRNGSSVKDESASPAFGFNSDGEDEDGYGGGNGLNSSGRPETEEEKRKNFLERNRQGECGGGFGCVPGWLSLQTASAAVIRSHAVVFASFCSHPAHKALRYVSSPT